MSDRITTNHLSRVIYFERIVGGSIIQLWLFRRFVFGLDLWEFSMPRYRFKSRRYPGVIGIGCLYFQDVRGRW